MPNTQSAKKRLRQNVVRRARNRAAKSVLRNQLRKVREALAAGNLEQASVEFQQTAKKFDKAAAAGVIHKNAAARTKSRLSALIRAAKTAKAS